MRTKLLGAEWWASKRQIFKDARDLVQDEYNLDMRFKIIEKQAATAKRRADEKAKVKKEKKLADAFKKKQQNKAKARGGGGGGSDDSGEEGGGPPTDTDASDSGSDTSDGSSSEGGGALGRMTSLFTSFTSRTGTRVGGTTRTSTFGGGDTTSNTTARTTTGPSTSDMERVRSLGGGRGEVDEAAGRTLTENNTTTQVMTTVGRTSTQAGRI